MHRLHPEGCSTLRHLEHTLGFDWGAVRGGRDLHPGWLERATAWRQPRSGTAAWRQVLATPGELSWAGLVVAQRQQRLPKLFRRGRARCRSRVYGWRPGLAERFARKLTVDGLSPSAPLAHAIRGYLDIIHVHPFDDGNTRAACTWLVWALVTAGLDVPDLEAVVRLPKPPGESGVVVAMAELLGGGVR